MAKLNKDTPEFHSEWTKLLASLEAWKTAPNAKERIAAVKESLEKLGLIVPIDFPDSAA
jgi:hypothetical protein